MPLQERYHPNILHDVLRHFDDIPANLFACSPLALHSHMDLELEDTLMIKLDQEDEISLEDVVLTREFILLLGELCKEEFRVGGLPVDDNEALVRVIWDRLNLPNSADRIGRKYRLFEVSESLGSMVNLLDGQRNVALKVETFCGLLGNIFDILVAAEGSCPIDEAQLELVYYEAGRRAGRCFGQSLQRDVWEAQNEMSLQEKLDAWCVFDSGVGFGNLSHRATGQVSDFSSGYSGTITVEGNFLATEREGGKANLCCVLSGYIAGVLSEIFQSEVHVRHPPSKCKQTIEGGTIYCEFDYEQAPLRQC